MPLCDLGAIASPTTTRFKVWAPSCKQVEVILGDRVVAMTPGAGGYFQAEAHAPAGTRYNFRLDGDKLRPDPCSRFQPEGPHGASEVVDPSVFKWTDAAWEGLSREGLVLYELHVGTFSPSGNWAGATERLAYLKDLGITCVELMPLAAFPGRFNWGYDGVNLFAPCAIYGGPDEFRGFVDRCHALGLAVMLDVVYNHFGPDGNYLCDFSPEYFTDKYPAEWGDPVNFENAPSVRSMVTQNAAHWIAEYHLDGLRLDATQNLYDNADDHIIRDIVDAARDAAGARNVVITCENESQNERVIRSKELAGYAADCLWIDDFHHTARVAVSGVAEAYLQDYHGNAQELLTCALSNSIYQGQWYSWQKQGRGTPLLERSPQRIVFYLQNHDQVANTLDGARMHVVGGAKLARAITTYFLMLPQTPMLFQGQELFSSAPFQFFADHGDELQEAVHKGRTEFLKQFPSFAVALSKEHIDIGEKAFRASRIDWTELDEPMHAGAHALHRELLRLRRTGDTLRGSTIGDRIVLLRFIGATDDRLVILNLGARVVISTALSDPLFAPPLGKQWQQLLHSEETRFGGHGAEPMIGEGTWSMTGKSACVMHAQKG